MNLDTDFPIKFYLNLNKHDERGRNVLNALLDNDMADVERIPAVDGRWVRNARGYSTPTAMPRHSRSSWHCGEPGSGAHRQ